MKRSLVVSIIGRPNVGKSTLFNRLMKKNNKAITHDRPGVTRDRHYGMAHFDEVLNEDPSEVILVDTGGFYPQKIDETNGTKEQQNINKFFNIMTEHAKMAIFESDLILLVLDVREGILPFDKAIADFLRKKKKSFWAVVNKFDSDKQWGEEADFYRLGIPDENFFMVSASHGLGISSLQLKIHQKIIAFNKQDQSPSNLQNGITPKEEVVGKVALIGAPNAGKSTLLNKLLGASRALVSNIPGTTVDPIEGFFDLYFGREANKLLEEKTKAQSDQILLRNYDEFRKNNPELYARWQEENDSDSETEKEADDDNNQSINLEISQLEEIEKSLEDEGIENKVNKIFGQDLGLNIDHDSGIKEKTKAEGSFWRSVHLIDTAGIRRQKAIDDFIESQSVFRSLRCITESDVVIFMVDVTLGIGHQDRRLIDISLEKGKSVIICLNKFDLLKTNLKDQKAQREWLLDLRSKVPWLQHCDLIPISAKYNKGLKALKKALSKTIIVRNTKLAAGQLNRCLFDLVERHTITPKGARGRPLKIKYTAQVSSRPPTFLLFSNKSRDIPEIYKRYLKNGIRREFDLVNTPIHLMFKTSSDLKKKVAIRKE